MNIYTCMFILINQKCLKIWTWRCSKSNIWSFERCYNIIFALNLRYGKVKANLLLHLLLKLKYANVYANLLPIYVKKISQVIEFCPLYRRKATQSQILKPIHNNINKFFLYVRTKGSRVPAACAHITLASAVMQPLAEQKVAACFWVSGLV